MDSPSEIKVGDKYFSLLISHETIAKRIAEIANELNFRFENLEVDIVVVMDGAECFARHLIPQLNFNCCVHKIKVKTYDGMHSTHVFKITDGMPEMNSARELILLEDIIDSGHTVYKLSEHLEEHHTKKIHLVTLLFKPASLKYPVKPECIGFEIGNEFVVGFGMDYNEEGRQLPDIYQCIEV
jgi:hypoxanthine phosphoribosyltransferase